MSDPRGPPGSGDWSGTSGTGRPEASCPRRDRRNRSDNNRKGAFPSSAPRYLRHMTCQRACPECPGAPSCDTYDVSLRCTPCLHFLSFYPSKIDVVFFPCGRITKSIDDWWQKQTFRVIFVTVISKYSVHPCVSLISLVASIICSRLKTHTFICVDETGY